jgi:release factor glutamine methyltransferase
VRIITPPGVFRPLSDTRLLADQARALAPAARVLDVCTGTGHLAVAAALAGARRVVAVDVSRRAVLAARLNARLNGVRVDVRRGDLLAPVGAERFDLVVSNPPYLPAVAGELPEHGPERAWDAGSDGRVLLDRLIAGAPRVLAPGGTLLLVQSSVCGESATLAALVAAGLHPRVQARRPGPLGPRLAARTAMLEARGLLPAGSREEDLLVVSATRPAQLLNLGGPDALIHAGGGGQRKEGQA